MSCVSRVLQKNVVVSAGPASGLWLRYSPDSGLALPSWTFRIALGSRLGLPLFLTGATCNLLAGDSTEACGKTLDQEGVHSTTCKCGGHVLQFHDCIKEVSWQACRAAGHVAYKEQVVPQWGRWTQKRQRRARGVRGFRPADAGDTADTTGSALEWVYEEAILDVVSFDPSTLQHHYFDCTVRNSIGRRYLEAGSSSMSGVAMRLAAEQKTKR